MAAEGFDAGSIFVQVVPSFRDTQRLIGNEGRKFGDQLEKDLSEGLERGAEKGAKKVGDKLKNVISDEVGKDAGKAGEKAADNYAGEFRTKLNSALRSMERELKPIEINTGSTKALAELDRLKAKIKELSESKIEPGMSTTKIRKDMDQLVNDISRLGENAEIEVKADTKAARRSVEAFKKYVDSIDPVVEVEVKLDKKLADRQLGAFEKTLRDRIKAATAQLGDNVGPEIARIKAQLATLGSSEIGIDVSAGEAMRELQAIHLELSQINALSPVVDVRVNSGKALTELTAINREVDRLDGKTAKVSSKGSLIDRLLGKGSSGKGDEVANAFRAFNGVLLTAITLGPALVPILAAIAGGMAALAPTALAGAAGVGVLALAFSGISDAVSALGDAQDKAGKDAVATGRTMRAAAQGVEDAQRSLARARRDAGQAAADAQKAVEQAVASAADSDEAAARRVADAREQAARSVESALKRQEDAEKRLANAQIDAKKAQDDLAASRLQAQKDLDDIADRSKQNALDIRQAQIDLFNATVANNATQADPGATNLEKEQSDINLKSAQLRIEELRKTQTDLAEQKKKADKGGVEGTDAVIAAQKNLNDALQAQKDAQNDVKDSAVELHRAQTDGTQSVIDALQAQADAAAAGQQAIADAEQQRTRVAESSARSISDAQRGLQRAQQGYADALFDTGEQGSTAMQKVKTAMDKLGPEAQAFALFIFGLRDAFFQLRAVAAAGVLPGVQELLQTLITTYGPGFTKFIADIAKVLGDLAVALSNSLTGTSWKNFFDVFGGAGPKLLKDFGETFILWLETGAEFLALIMPFALQLSGALLDMAKHANEFMKSEKGQKLWTDFFKYVARVGPEVKDFFLALGGAIINIGRALAPMGEAILGILTDMLSFIAGMDPDTLQLIVFGILALAAAFQIAALATTLWGLAFTLATTPLQLVVAIIVLVVAALVLLYTRSETARTIINFVFSSIASVITFYWTKVLFPILTALWKLIQYVAGVVSDAWVKYIQPALSAFGGFLKNLWDKVLGPVFGFIGSAFSAMAKGVKWAWDFILWPIFKVFAKIAWELWTLTIKIAFAAIGLAFSVLATGFKWVWDHVLKPLFDLFMWVIGNDLVAAFEAAVGFIKKHWDTLQDIAKAPVKFVIDTVINGALIGGFNKLADLVKMDRIEDIKLPPGFSTGGVYPGYTPGRDIGYIGVSGGEAIMRPEWTRAMRELDPGYIDEANKRARTSGVGGVKRFLGGFKDGGEVGNASLFNRTKWRGKTLDFYTVRMLEAAEKLTGQTVRITQGSYSTAVAASGSTHAGGGAFDLGWPGGALGTALVAALRIVGTASWHRDPSQGPWPHHIHGLAIGDPTMSDSAQRQVRDYYNGGDGLGGTDDGPDVKKDPSLLGKLLGGLGGLAGWVGDAIGKPLDYLKGLISGPIDKMKEQFGGGKFVEILSKMPERIMEGMVSKIKGLNPFGGGNSADVDGLKQSAKEMLANYGWADQWDSFDWIVNKESSWNPNAQNPTSSAFGLMQFLDGTWPGGQRVTDPREQLRLGMEYIKDRYGNPQNAKAFHQSHGWYKDGGVVPDSPASLFDTPTGLYDNGGQIPEGLSQVLNLTGGNEHAAVFTTDQWDRLQTNGGGDINIPITMVGSEATPGEVADEVLFAARRIKRGGAYANA